MKRIFTIPLLALISFVLINANSPTVYQSTTQQSAAQPDSARGSVLATLRREFKSAAMLTSGEKLEYEVKFSRFPLKATVGVVTFEYLGSVASKSVLSPEGNPSSSLIQGLNVSFNPAPEDQLLHLRATAVSKGVLVSLFGIDVKDRFETLVNANDFSARLSFKEVKEGKKHNVQSSVFDRTTQQVKYLTTDLANPQAPPRAKFVPLQEGMMSLLSSFYFVRLQKFKEGQVLRFPVSTDEQNYQFDIVVGKRSKIKTDCGKIKTIMLEPNLFGPGKLISRQGKMNIIVTDDRRHIPLQVFAKTSSGTVTAKLINFKNNCKIEDPETEEAQLDAKDAKDSKDEKN